MAKRRRKRIFIDTSKGALGRLQSDVRTLKRDMKNREFKFEESTINDAVVSTTGTIQGQIFTIPQGDDIESRDGNKIVLTSINARFIATLPATSTVTETADVIRVVLVVDNSANGALPSVADILSLTDIQAFKNLNNTDRFRTILDKTIAINALAGGSNGTTHQSFSRDISFKFFKKLNLPIKYTGTSGLIGTIASNNIVCLYISEAGFVGLQGEFRVRYTDS